MMVFSCDVREFFSFLYIWIFRSVPVMVWFVLFYTGFAMAGIFRFQDIEIFNVVIRGNVQAAIICLSMREAAYMAEVIRGGILSVENGQIDASKSLGMSWWHLSDPKGMRKGSETDQNIIRMTPRCATMQQDGSIWVPAGCRGDSPHPSGTPTVSQMVSRCPKTKSKDPKMPPQGGHAVP